MDQIAAQRNHAIRLGIPTFADVAGRAVTIVSAGYVRYGRGVQRRH